MEADMAPAAVLRLMKRLERLAGRSPGPRWSPRSLDLDILCHGRRAFGWPPIRRRERGRLILPHPEMHKRAFMLVPLLEIAPHWRHPVLGVSGRVLLARLGRREARKVAPALDFMSSVCDKNAT
jgi:2-amino-4-hydroxy-6-hydroxymethyldihydropteridine diphosphokinase